jgi:hypothetical protein
MPYNDPRRPCGRLVVPDLTKMRKPADVASAPHVRKDLCAVL